MGVKDEVGAKDGPSTRPPASRTSMITRVRGTLLITSRERLFELGHRAPYERNLGAEAAAALSVILAASWVPASLAHEHYAAADALDIPESASGDCHLKVAERVHGIFLRTALRNLRAIGILTPWNALALIPKLVKRLFDGGETDIERVGESEARVLFAGNPLVRHRHFRAGLRYHLLSGMLSCSSSPQVREESFDATSGTIRFVIRWSG